MYLLYLDASGTVTLNDPTSTNYVLAGVAVHELTWFGLENRLQTLRSRSGLDLSAELHAKDICNPNPVEDDHEDFSAMDLNQRLALWDAKLNVATSYAKRKRLKAERPFAHLGRAQRNLLYESVLDVIGTHDRGVRLFASAVHKQHLFRTTGQRDLDVTGFALEQIISRFSAFLERSNKTPGHGRDKGMLVFDNDPSNERQIREIFARWREKGHRWGTLDQIIDVPFFIDSRACSGVQAADICAHACRRHIERPEKLHERRNLERLIPRFDAAGGIIHGFRHDAPHGCLCRFCQERRPGNGAAGEGNV